MKRSLLLTAILILVLVLVPSCAFGERALVNPHEAYESFMEEGSDGSEQLIYIMLDSMNDEETLVNENGSVLIIQNFVITDGYEIYESMKVETRLFGGEYGRVMHMTAKLDGEIMGEIYQTESFSYQLDDDGRVQKQTASVSDGDFNGHWEHYVFPYYTPLEGMPGMRQDDENTCFLVFSDEKNTLIEYVTSSSDMTLLGANIYTRNEEDGNYYLTMYTEIMRDETAEIPKIILDAIKADVPKAKTGRGA